MMSKIKSAFTNVKNWLSNKLFHAYYIIYGWFSHDVSFHYGQALQVLNNNLDPQIFDCFYKDFRNPLMLQILIHELEPNNQIKSFSLIGCTLNDKAVKIIADFLQRKTSITTIDLSKSRFLDNINNSSITILFNAIRNNLNLLRINLSSAHWFNSDSFVQGFFDFFKSSKIADINLEDTGLSQNAANALLASLRKNKTIAKINLEKNEKFTAEKMVDLMPFIKESKSLKAFSFDSNDSKIIEDVKEATESSTTIWQVKINGNNFFGLYLVLDMLVYYNNSGMLDFSKRQISIPSLRIIIEFAKNNKIKALYLNRCDLGIKHVSMLAEFITKQASLEEISLNENNIGNEGAQILLKAIADSASLQRVSVLNIKADRLLSFMSDTLSDALKNPDCKIKKIACGGNDLGVFRNNPPNSSEDLPQSFIDMLTTNKSVVDLNLDGSGIDTAGLQKLATFLENYEVLQKLDLSNNNRVTTKIEDAGIAAIFAALQKNKSITGFNMYRANIRPDRAENIAAALRCNNTLETLNLGCNELNLDAAKLIAKAILDNPMSMLRQIDFGMDPSNNQEFNETIEAINSGRDKKYGFKFFAMQNFVRRNRDIKRYQMPTSMSLPVELVRSVNSMLGASPLKIRCS